MFGSMQTRMRQFWGILRYQTKPITDKKEIRLRILAIKVEIIVYKCSNITKVLLTSTSWICVSSGISRNITVHRVWLGLTLRPSPSTTTLGDSENSNEDADQSSFQVQCNPLSTLVKKIILHTSQNLGDQSNITSKFSNLIEIGNGPYRHILVRIHLCHQVGVMG